MKKPMSWIPSLYFVQGMQFFVVMLIAGLMFKNMGIPNDKIAHWTGVMGLAWAFKPLWSPFLELFKSKKKIVVIMQYASAIGLGLIALSLQTPFYFSATVAILFFLAYFSATHDIACDGLYMASLSNKLQATYAGWQGAFFNASKFITLGGLLILAGYMEKQWGVFNAWSIIFVMLALLLLGLSTYNLYTLPNPISTEQVLSSRQVMQTLIEVGIDFFQKPRIWMMIIFIILFRIAEGQVQTIGPLFLLEARDKGGLGLSTEQIGGIYGTVGTAGFLIGSILGGYFTAYFGLKRSMPWLIIAMAFPSIVFAILSGKQPSDLTFITFLVAAEMLGYGFGFVGMILFIMQVVAPGKYQTAHYALGTGVMQLGFILAKTFSGDIQIALGYNNFFIWTIICGLPPIIMLWFIHFPEVKKDEKTEDAA